MTIAPFPDIAVPFENDPSPHPVGSIYCIGRNYADHAKELGNAVPQGEPVVFLKSRTAIRGLAPEEMGFKSDTFHHEIELVLYIGKDIFMGQSAGWSAVSGITLGLDLTRRDVQTELKKKGLPWTTAKSFAGSAVLAPFLSRDLWKDLSTFEFHLKVNGELRQSGRTSQMIFDVPTILTFLASFQPLRKGDIVFTGTPAGVNGMRVGDQFELGLEAPAKTWTGRL